MSKTKLQQMTDFLMISLKGAIKANDIDAWQENGTLMLNGQDLGDGIKIARWKSQAVITIENFPSKRINPYNVLAFLSVFLSEFDQEREQFGLNDPEIDIDEISSDNTTIIIEMDVIDDLELIPDPEGPITYFGEKYLLAPIENFVAENVDVELVNEPES